MGGFFLLDKVVKLVGGGSVINGAYPVIFFGIYAEFNVFCAAMSTNKVNSSRATL